MLKSPLKYALSAALACAALIGPSEAGVLNWTFNFTLDDGVTGSGTFVSEDSPSGGPFLITSLSGVLVDGGDTYAMSLLSPGPPPDNHFNDNLISTASSQLDGYGLGFTAESYQWAIWATGGGYGWCNNSFNGADHHCSWFVGGPGDPHGAARFSASIPEPTTWALVAIGFAGAGLAACRRKAAAAIVG